MGDGRRRARETGLGQPGPELTLLLAIAITQPIAKKGWCAASALAAGFAIKIFPGVLAVTFLLRRQWRTFLIFSGTAAALMLLPWLVVIFGLSGPRAPSGTDTWSGTPDLMSWGIPSVALRALDPPAPGGPLPPDWQAQPPDLRLPPSHRWLSIGSAAATLVAGIALLAAALWRNAPAPGNSKTDAFAMAALVSLSVAASPVCWYHYQVFQYPGLALLLCHFLRSRQWGLLAVTLALGALLFPVPFAGITAYYAKYGKWTASLPELYLLTSLAPGASLALFGLFVREAKLHLRASLC